MTGRDTRPPRRLTQRDATESGARVVEALRHATTTARAHPLSQLTRQSGRDVSPLELRCRLRNKVNSLIDHLPIRGVGIEMAPLLEKRSGGVLQVGNRY